MQKIDSWVRTEVHAFNQLPVNLIQNALFHRREPILKVKNDQVFYSPAYGIVIGVNKVNINNSDSLVNAKGVKYSLKQMVGNDKEVIKYIRKCGGDCLVIDVFMTYASVHQNMFPTDAIFVKHKELPPLHTLNYPMLETEEYLFQNKLDEALTYTKDYLVNNQRAINTFFNSNTGLQYYTVQLGDDYVDVICNKAKVGRRYKAQDYQGNIENGSGCSLIIPITTSFDVESLIEVGDVVRAEDALAKISKINNKLVNEDITSEYNVEITDETWVDPFETLMNDNSYEEIITDK